VVQGTAAVTGRGNSFANGASTYNGAAEAGPMTGRLKVLGWEYVWARAMSTTIYDLGG
jgi:hypothetical protein